MSADHNFQPKIIGIICNWCCYGGADLCGVSRFQYPPHIRLIRVMCSARVDMAHIHRAFINEQDGVFVGGCHLCDCHYVTNGNFTAYSMVQVFKKLLVQIGIFPERLRIEWVSAGEGIRFANFMNEYSEQLTKLGPIGKAEGITKEDLDIKFEAIRKIIPFVRLSIAQRLNSLPRSEEAYYEYFSSKEFDDLFDELFAGKLATSQIMTLLKEKPLTTGEISEKLKLNSSDVSGYMNLSSRQGLVKFNTEKKHYELVTDY